MNKNELKKELKPYTIIMILLIAIIIAGIIVFLMGPNLFEQASNNIKITIGVIVIVIIVIMFFCGRKRSKIKRSYCKYCGARYNRGDISFEWTGKHTSTAKTEVSEYRITCHCSKCDKITSFTEDIVTRKYVDDYTTQNYDPKDSINKFFDL